MAGVRVVGYQVNVAFKSAKASGTFQGSQVIIGDGQIEEVAELGGSGAYPFAPSSADQVVLRLQSLLAVLVLRLRTQRAQLATTRSSARWPSPAGSGGHPSTSVHRATRDADGGGFPTTLPKVPRRVLAAAWG